MNVGAVGNVRKTKSVAKVRIKIAKLPSKLNLFGVLRDKLIQFLCLHHFAVLKGHESKQIKAKA